MTALTEREREVVTLVAAGLSNDEIAAKLVVSPLTAKTHVSRAMTKLCARDRAQLVVLAYEYGLAEPGLAVQRRLNSYRALTAAGRAFRNVPARTTMITGRGAVQAARGRACGSA